MANRERKQQHFTIRHTPDYQGSRRLRPWMLLPLAAAVLLFGISGVLDSKEAKKPQVVSPGTSSPVSLPAGSTVVDSPSSHPGPEALQEVIDSLNGSQWGQETLDRAAVLCQSYQQENSVGAAAATAYLELLLTPSQSDQLDTVVLERLSGFLGDKDNSRWDSYRTALDAVYQAVNQ